MTEPLPAAPERFASLLRILQQAVADRLPGRFLTPHVVVLICNRVAEILRRFTRLVARINAGTFKPRRPYTRTPAIDPKPRQPDPLPSAFGWLVPLLPYVHINPITAVTCRGRLQDLFDDAEMQALMAAAPAEMGRILRPLCWMLRLKPPPILARRRRPAAADPAPEPAGSAPPEPPPPREPAAVAPPPALRPAALAGDPPTAPEPRPQQISA